ncbi:MAG TPA: glycoside hydrolase family 15 protein [Stellaceae bacterium]|jgi:GH15 family glucan-1,4-alpha-glucosidase|nr:glycoside hydrolase family 15 protein [Stellaceae bacterium]
MDMPEKPQRIEDYALIGNCLTAALVGRNGSIDWLCFPRFDSPACFAALLGNKKNGRWQIVPAEPCLSIERRYRPETLVLETRFRTASGSVLVTDFMPLPLGRNIALAPDRRRVDLVRIIQGEQGSVPMTMEMIFRFDYGSIVPWVRRRPDGLSAVAGPDALILRTPVDLVGRDETTVAAFTVHAGETIPFTLSWFRSHQSEPAAYDTKAALNEAVDHWQNWSRRYAAKSEWRDAEIRSLLTLKALTYHPTGGIVAAPTTSLPEKFGGVRNWDYRFCWLRDATFTLYALLLSGYREEAREWREWLLRAVAGAPSEVQVMYGLAGERRLPEYELPLLDGYAASRPVRIGNAAHTQRQTDIFGEIMDAFYSARLHGIGAEDDALQVQKVLLEFLETHWQLPDSGIWESRGDEKRNTHSAVMAWVAFDRAIKSVEKYGLKGPVERWCSIRDEIHRTVCTQGMDHERGVFVQAFGGKALDSALLRIPLVGFLPPDDKRVVATAEAVARDLTEKGFVYRYRTNEAPDGLPHNESAFLICSFWLADNFALMGREREARELFDRLLDIRNDVGLLAEEYDPFEKRFLGNFPQAFSHVGLINTAHNLALRQGPADHRSAQ